MWSGKRWRCAGFPSYHLLGGMVSGGLTAQTMWNAETMRLSSLLGHHSKTCQATLARDVDKSSRGLKTCRDILPGRIRAWITQYSVVLIQLHRHVIFRQTPCLQRFICIPTQYARFVGNDFQTSPTGTNTRGTYAEHLRMPASKLQSEKPWQNISS